MLPESTRGSLCARGAPSAPTSHAATSFGGPPRVFQLQGHTLLSPPWPLPSCPVHRLDVRLGARAREPGSRSPPGPGRPPRGSSPQGVVPPLTWSCPSGPPLLLPHKAAPWGLLFSVGLWVTLHTRSSSSHVAFVLIYRSPLSFFWALSC